MSYDCRESEDDFGDNKVNIDQKNNNQGNVNNAVSSTGNVVQNAVKFRTQVKVYYKRLLLVSKEFDSQEEACGYYCGYKDAVRDHGESYFFELIGPSGMIMRGN